MSKYISKPIGEVCDIRRGASPRPIDDWMSKTGVPWVKIADATKNDSRFIYETEGFIKEEGKKHSVEVFPEDLIISNSATPALPKIMKIHACIHDGWLLAQNFNGVTRDYLYYQIKYLQKYLINQGNGSIFKNLKTDILKEFPIRIPVDTNGKLDLKTQEKISNVLKSIEDKIENNNNINAMLESMAKTLYDYWFLQFEFPNEEGKPYKSSGGKMIYNEELKKEIPKGWEVKRIKDCIKHINTGLNPRDNFVLNDGGNIKYVTVKNLTTNGTLDFSGCDTITTETKKMINKRSLIAQGDILFASIAPLGRCFLLYETPSDWEINESVFSIRPNVDIINSEYLYMFLTSDWFIKKSEHASTGSIFSGIRVAVLEDTLIVKPSKDVLDKFKTKIEPLYKTKFNNGKQNQQLAELRDFLLPMLMNGQVTLKSNEQ